MKLIDSNILIYAALPQHAALKALLQEDNIFVSNISRLEVLGFHSITEAQITFFNAVINKAIELRQNKKMTVGDAIVAATALLNNHELITRNTDDFKHVTSLTIINPIEK